MWRILFFLMRLQPFVATLALYLPDKPRPSKTPVPHSGMKGRQQGFEVPKPTLWPYLMFE